MTIPMIPEVELLPTHLRRTLTDLADDYSPEAVRMAVELIWPELTPAVPSSPSRETDRPTAVVSGNRHAVADVRRFSSGTSSAALLRVIADKPCTAQAAALRVVTGDLSLSALEGVRRRVSDLAKGGLIADSGLTDSNPGSRDQSVVWQITLEGVAALQRLRETGWSRPKAVA